MPLSRRFSCAFLFGVLAIAGLTGCQREPYSLAIVGYDYTDRAVADFSVNGQWGANIEVSDPGTGGGKVICCVAMSRSTKTPFWVDVKYQMDALEAYSPRKVIEPPGPYRKARVEVKGPIPPDPRYLEIHFYPDGHIEGAISGRNGPSDPRLKLEARSAYAR
jgi:hypothetical protein